MAPARHLHVARWEDYQHYRNRRAPWIKMYTAPIELPLEHPTFTNLSDGAKLTLHHVRIIAGVTANQIPETALTRDRLNMKTTPKIDELVDAGFVMWCTCASVVSIADASAHSKTEQPAGVTGDASARAGGRARGRAHSQDSPGSTLGNSLVHGETKHRARARELVERFEVTERHRAWAAEKTPGVDIDAATDAWRDHFRANGYKTRAGPVADADGCWRNWMRNEVKFSRGKHGTTGTGNGSGGSKSPRNFA